MSNKWNLNATCAGSAVITRSVIIMAPTAFFAGALSLRKECNYA